MKESLEAAGLGCPLTVIFNGRLYCIVIQVIQVILYICQFAFLDTTFLFQKQRILTVILLQIQ